MTTLRIGTGGGVSLGPLNVGNGAGVALAGGGVTCIPYSQIDGSVAEAATFAHLADGVVALTITLPSSGSGNIRVRQVDNDNYWRIAWGASGTLNLFEVIAGSPTNRGSAAVVFVSGHRLVITLSDERIEVWSGPIGSMVQRIVYASAVNFKTAIVGKLDLLGADGAASNLKTWSLACRASEGV